MSKDKQNEISTSTKPVLSGVEMLSTSLEGKRVGYKETKLGWIPEDWDTPTISEVFEFLKTTSFSREQLNYDDENETYYIHYGDIHATYKTPILDFEIIKSVPKLNSDVALPASVQYLENGDVIIADASEDYDGVGTAIELKNIDKKKVISGLHTFALRDREELTVEGFRTYIFKNPIVKKALKTIATGSKVFGISKGNVQKFEIVLPTLPEQQKIANILNTWDKAIAAQEKLIAQKQALKKGLMQQLLTGKKRFAGFVEEWEEIRLKDLTTLITKGTTPTSLGYSFLDEGINFIKAESISKSGFIDIDYTPKISIDCDKVLKRSRLKENDVVFSIAGTLGRTSIITKKDLPANINQALSIVRLKDKQNIEFINFCLNTNAIDKYIKAMVSVGAQPNINLQQVGNIKLKLPCKEEQNKIVEMLKNSENDLFLAKEKKDSMQKQKQGLMQQLLTGEKRVKA